MNCEHCSTPMVWFGSVARGRMDCPKCRQIANIWHIPVFGPEGDDVTWLEFKARDSDGPFEKYFRSENALTAALLRRSRQETEE